MSSDSVAGGAVRRPPRTTHRDRTLIGAAGLGVGLVLAVTAVLGWTRISGGSPFTVLGWVVAGVLAATASACGLAAVRSETRWRAVWMAAGAAAGLRAATSAATVAGLIRDGSAPDLLLQLAAGAAVLAAVLLIARRRLETYAWSWPDALDASVIMAAIGFTSWDAVVETFAGRPLSAAGVAALGCGMVAAAAAIGLAAIGSRSRGAIGLPILLAACGFLAWTVTQGGYVYQDTVHPLHPAAEIAVGWTLAGSLIGLGAVAALRPQAAGVVMRWRLEDINLPIVLAGIVLTQLFVTVSVLNRRGDIGTVLAGAYTVGVVLARLVLTVRSRRRLGQALGEALTTQRRLERQRDVVFAQMLRAEADERARVAADLHDDTVQIMVATLVSLDRVASASRDGDGQRVAAAAAAARQTLNEAVERTRQLMFELRPPLLETHGLEAATRDAAAVLQRSTRLRVEVSATGTARYSPAVEALVFRTLQESLTNVRKHAHARAVHIDLRDDGATLHARVSDDGRGFDVAASASPTRERMHYGIAMMTERVRLAGGDCWISSMPGRGCTVALTLPHAGSES